MGLPSPTDGREASPSSGENGRYGPWRWQYPHQGDAWTSPLNHHGDWGAKAPSHRRQLWISLIAFVVVYGTIATVDLLLMLRYFPQGTTAPSAPAAPGLPGLDLLRVPAPRQPVRLPARRRAEPNAERITKEKLTWPRTKSTPW